MLVSSVSTSAPPEYSAALPSHWNTMPSWKEARASQFAARSSRAPGANGPVVSRSRGDFAVALRSHRMGTAKNRAKKASTTVTNARPSHAAGSAAVFARVRVKGAGAVAGRTSVALKEASLDDEEHAQPQRDDEQEDRDGGGPVVVGLLERVEVGELVERVVHGDDALAGLRQDARLDEELGPVRKRHDGHVGDPLAHHGQLDAMRGEETVGAVDLRGLHDDAGDVVARAVEHDDPAARTGPEGDDREDDWEVARRDGLRGGLVAQRVQHPGDGADGRVEHEEPEHDARGPGEGAGHVVDEPQAGAHAAPGEPVDEQRQDDDEEDQPDQPEQHEQRDVLDGGAQSQVLVHREVGV